MSEQKKAYCVFTQIHPHLPEDLRSYPERYWFAKATFPKGIKINGERSPAYYLKSEVLAYWKKHFGIVRPDCVQSLIDSDPGFNIEPAARKPEKRPKKAARP